eukprot:30915-Pelagococcus_subviridis.AAC.2
MDKFVSADLRTTRRVSRVSVEQNLPRSRARGASTSPRGRFLFSLAARASERRPRPVGGGGARRRFRVRSPRGVARREASRASERHR